MKHTENNPPKGLCKRCGKPLVPVGESRKNGCSHVDWETRRLHKKCRAESQLVEWKRQDDEDEAFFIRGLLDYYGFFDYTVKEFRKEPGIIRDNGRTTILGGWFLRKHKDYRHSYGPLVISDNETH